MILTIDGTLCRKPNESFRGTLFPKPVTGQELFFSTRYNKPAQTPHIMLKRFKCFLPATSPSNQDHYASYITGMHQGLGQVGQLPHQILADQKAPPGGGGTPPRAALLPAPPDF